ncbi:hypothetical protein Pelo_11295 [Pelomyxa schiedti]|nr:hypothetical protein Pelo_11295 [Pelomyxa schiedti]
MASIEHNSPDYHIHHLSKTPSSPVSNQREVGVPQPKAVKRPAQNTNFFFQFFRQEGRRIGECQIQKIQREQPSSSFIEIRILNNCQCCKSTVCEAIAQEDFVPSHHKNENAISKYRKHIRMHPPTVLLPALICLGANMQVHVNKSFLLADKNFRFAR